ncbi:MAG: DUF1326 domain-containing protein [Clostridiales Family XIII bacterium]|jgi:hypothetical protein|nr:DUF1326 domain-containing protein [Clostridiales Family XIII bacterium]
MSDIKWRIEGEYIETCNCNVVCPCLVNSIGNNKVPPTRIHCDLVVGYHITNGRFDSVDLDGLNYVVATYSPGPTMEVPNWSVGYYIDGRATDEQFEAMCKLLSGDYGGPPEGIAAVREDLLGMTRANIEIRTEGEEHTIKIDGIADVAVKYLPSIYGDGKPVMFTNIHPLLEDGNVIQGVTGQMRYEDYGFTFNNTGMNGFLGHFAWQDDFPMGTRSS